MRFRAWVSTLSLAIGLFSINVALNGPLFLPGETVYRGSIEAGYASMARFIAAHPNPWGWNPTQYCGLPTQFTYLPGLPYVTAPVIWLLPDRDPAHLYRIVVATFACLGPVTLFLFVLYFTKRRGWALACAAAYSLFSPSYGLIELVSHDRGIVYLPWRIQVLLKYGEGPHNVGLTILPLALMALWAAGVGRKSWQIFLAAVMLAAIALTNWVASMALAFCYVAMLLTAAGTTRITGLRATRLLAAAGLAYLITCFWLTPRFVKTIAFNWPADAFGYHARRMEVVLLVGLVVGLLLLWKLLRRFPGQSYISFLTLSLFVFAYMVLNYYWYGIDTIPESRRYALELEMVLFPFLFELLRLAMGSMNRGLKFGALGFMVFLVYAGAGQAWSYATQGYSKWKPFPKEESVEYRLASWIAERHPVGRVFASGGVRFRLDSWFEIPQVGGTFESGLQNRLPLHFAYQIRQGSNPAAGERETLLQLKALAVEYLVVNGPKSKEYYRDFKNPRKFKGLLEAAYRDEDDVIYRLPVTSIAHLVRPEELPDQPPVGGATHLLGPYVAAIDDPFRPKLRTKWSNADELHIEGPIPEGLLVSVQVTYDRGWIATQDGVPIAITGDRLGFIMLRPRPTALARIILKYRGTTGQRLWAAVSCLALAGGLAGLFLQPGQRGSCATAADSTALS